MANSIPPELVHILLTRIAPNPQMLANFRGAFPTFPRLHGDEWRVWLGYDFENGMSDAEIMTAFDGRISPAIRARLAASSLLGGGPRLAKNSTGRILDWTQNSPNNLRDAHEAISRAMAVDEFQVAVGTTLNDACHLAAALVDPVI